jgi:predicted amidohydrolase YtcJ
MKTDGPPDVSLHNGRINTLDPLRPEIRNLSIRNGRIQAVENVSEAQRGEKTLVIDLDGRRVIPGLNDPETKFPEYIVPTKTAAHA